MNFTTSSSRQSKHYVAWYIILSKRASTASSKHFLTSKFIIVHDVRPLSISSNISTTSMHFSRYRYSFHQSTWVSCGLADPELPSRRHMHPDGPATGKAWMRQPITFEKLKLTNNQMDQNGYVSGFFNTGRVVQSPPSHPS